MKQRGIIFWIGVAVVLLLATATPGFAQTPTPEPWPTPIVTTDYVVYQTVTYGEGGVILGLVFVGGVLLITLFAHLAEMTVDQ